MIWKGRGDLRKPKDFEEEDAFLAEQDHKIQDNSHDKLDCVARNALKPVNLPRKDYWSKSTHSIVENTIPGSRWIIDHQSPDDLNKA